MFPFTIDRTKFVYYENNDVVAKFDLPTVTVS